MEGPKKDDQKKPKWLPPDQRAKKAPSAKVQQIVSAREEKDQARFADYDWAHTLAGEIKGAVITGGHCRAACERNGITVRRLTEPDEDGFYSAKLTTSTAVKERSTFFPDTWDEDDIKNAIRSSRPAGGNRFEIMTELGRGRMLEFKSGIYFPV